MLIDWAQASAPALASFLASLVEAAEALTIVLAVGIVRGWRGALAGTGLALLTLGLMIALLGPTIARIPLDWVKLIVGALLLLFGLRWLRKAILRAAGVIPLRDEQVAFDRQMDGLRGLVPAAGRWDGVALATAFEITMIEGLEVVFIVIAIGAGSPSALNWASIGAVAAVLLAAVLGVSLRRPLTAVPENTFKFIVGVLLASFGTFWVGEGSGLPWPADDASILVLIAGFAWVSLLGVHGLRPRSSLSTPHTLR